MKIFLFALSLVATMTTDKNVTVTGSNTCYYCEGSNRPESNQDCWDESKLNKEKYQCTGKLFLGALKTHSECEIESSITSTQYPVSIKVRTVQLFGMFACFKNFQCSDCSVFSLFVQNELFGLFAMRIILQIVKFLNVAVRPANSRTANSVRRTLTVRCLMDPAGFCD